MYVSFVCLKGILFRDVQVFMFDVSFCAPHQVSFSSHVDDVKANIWIVCYTFCSNNLEHTISYYSISSCALYGSLQECFKHTSLKRPTCSHVFMFIRNKELFYTLLFSVGPPVLMCQRGLIRSENSFVAL